MRFSKLRKLVATSTPLLLSCSSSSAVEVQTTGEPAQNDIILYKKETLRALKNTTCYTELLPSEETGVYQTRLLPALAKIQADIEQRFGLGSAIHIYPTKNPNKEIWGKCIPGYRYRREVLAQFEGLEVTLFYPRRETVEDSQVPIPPILKGSGIVVTPAHSHTPKAKNALTIMSPSQQEFSVSISPPQSNVIQSGAVVDYLSAGHHGEFEQLEPHFVIWAPAKVTLTLEDIIEIAKFYNAHNKNEIDTSPLTTIKSIPAVSISN